MSKKNKKVESNAPNTASSVVESADAEIAEVKTETEEKVEEVKTEAEEKVEEVKTEAEEKVEEVKTEAVGKAEVKKKASKLGIASVVLSAVSVLSLGAVIGLSTVVINQNKKQNEFVNKYIEGEYEEKAKALEQTGSYVEDGYKVGGTYEIKSTKVISDAYISGNSEGLSVEDKETLDMATKVLEGIIKDGMSDYEKEKAIFDWIADNINHDGSNVVIAMPGASGDSYTPHGVLSSRQAVCVGYATTFRLLANMVGLDCHIVHNDFHSWDIVKVEDEWYQLDIYSAQTLKGESKYSYFNLTDAEMKSLNDWESDSLPIAKGSKYSYAQQNAVTIDSLMDIPKLVKDNYDKKKYISFFRFKNKLTDDDIKVANEIVTEITYAVEMGALSENFVPMAANEGGNENNSSTASTNSDDCAMDETAFDVMESYMVSARWYSDGEDSYILGIVIDVTQENSDLIEIDEKIRKEIMNKITEVFGIDMTNYEEQYSDSNDEFVGESTDVPEDDR